MLAPTLVLVGAGLSAAASVAVTSQKLAAISPSSPTMFPVSVVVANKSGGTLGRAQSGDIITLVFSKQIDEPTMCSGWSNASSTQSITLQWSIVDGGAGDDSLQATGTSTTCTNGFRIGTIALGAAGYNKSTTTMNFTGTTNALSVGASTTTLTVTLGTQSGGTVGTVSSGAQAVWTPDALIKDRSANTCGSNLAATTATVQF